MKKFLLAAAMFNLAACGADLPLQKKHHDKKDDAKCECACGDKCECEENGGKCSCADCTCCGDTTKHDTGNGDGTDHGGGCDGGSCKPDHE